MAQGTNCILLGTHPLNSEMRYVTALGPQFFLQMLVHVDIGRDEIH
jgi:hypothetical protein